MAIPTDLPKLKKGQQADIGLLLEGTYPWIRGGVSSWVHQIIDGLPQFTFAIIFIGDKPETYAEIRYELPDNVLHVEAHFVMQAPDAGEPKARKGDEQVFSHSEAMHDWFRDPGGSACPHEQISALFNAQAQGRLDIADLHYSEAAWQQITEQYERYSTDPSFLDYFWTVRTMHGPIFAIAEMAKRAAPARVYHAVSTGYAGLLGTYLHLLRDAPFFITEHGIYTKERKIDLAQVEWIKDAEAAFGAGLATDLGYLRRLWIRFFEGLGRLAYHYSDPILAITEINKDRQINDGADPSRVSVIANGVDLSRFTPLREKRKTDGPPVIGFIGRIVPIKDVKTLIRAMRTVCTQMPEAEAWLIGNDDEDPEYARECKDLVVGLDLDKQVKFLGFQNVAEMLPQMDVMIMTSISEGLPLVLIEAFAAGVPCIATDVGACREVIEGGSEEDRALGSAGGVTGIADPEGTASELLALLQDKERWQAAQAAGIARVETYYDEKLLFDSYQRIYTDALKRADKP